MAADQPTLTPEYLGAQVQRLAGAGLSAKDQIAIAVSGGTDSLALMWLAARAFGARAHVLTVDHGLRAESAAECAQVMALAAAEGLAATTLPVAMQAGPNLQEAAREARYAAMAQRCAALGIRHLLTAHHRDDQAETLLMRLARGSGIAGLSGIRPVSIVSGLSIIRPLLAHGRAGLHAIVHDAGWTAADDPSNRNPRFDRTHARSLLAATPWLEADRLAASAGHLAEAEAALKWIDERIWESRAVQQGEGLRLDPEALPAELKRRLLVRGLEALGAPTPRGPDLARLLERLDAGSPSTLGGVKATVRDGRWHLNRAATPALRRLPPPAR